MSISPHPPPAPEGKRNAARASDWTAGISADPPPRAPERDAEKSSRHFRKELLRETTAVGKILAINMTAIGIL